MINQIKKILQNKRIMMSLLIHLSAISLFVLPEVITNIDDNRPVSIGVVIKTILYLSIFYINYFLINRFLDRKNGKWQFFGMNILLLFVASIVILLTSHGYTDKEFHPKQKPPHPHISPEGKPFEHVHPPHEHHQGNKVIHAIERLSRDLFIAILTIALAFAVRIAARWIESQRKQVTLIASQRETELENLKNQINPHFLFNTLNAIYALIDINPSQAQTAIHELSRMMRYAIYETSEMVTLNQEFDFLNNYISLMRMRMNPDRPIETSLSCNNYGNDEIAPLLFIPIIENAFKYGNTGNVTNPIKINITVNNGVVKCYTFNHFDKEKSNSYKDSGIGFSNLQRRLNLLYGEDMSFNIVEQDDTFQVQLTINLNNSKHRSNDNPQMLCNR